MVVGRERALQTNVLENEPIARIKKLKMLLDDDFRAANQIGDSKSLKQIERSMASLRAFWFWRNLSMMSIGERWTPPNSVTHLLPSIS